jgi:hypothetical protein
MRPVREDVDVCFQKMLYRFALNLGPQIGARTAPLSAARHRNCLISQFEVKCC